MKSELVGPDGNPVQSDRFAPCPTCGAGSEKRTQSSGFGLPHLICTKCGHEFKEIPCPVAL